MDAILLKFIRQSKGISQAELARITGVSAALICQIEKNKKNISDKVRRSVNDYFGAEYIRTCRIFIEQNKNGGI
ncbi:helix-turn-helix transcriptional regulator [Cytobacillus sp. FSL M8-0252]|uniref:helix-turn-helix domain-containing protein n=1 Tax=Cytobacillus sp. FSL M8-0252 TaxID=2921621 RepID=UPI0030F4D514